jgi:hypothetical protein
MADCKHLNKLAPGCRCCCFALYMRALKLELKLFIREIFVLLGCHDVMELQFDRIRAYSTRIPLMSSSW